jgi:hypothetical protein
VQQVGFTHPRLAVDKQRVKDSLTRLSAMEMPAVLARTLLSPPMKLPKVKLCSLGLQPGQHQLVKGIGWIGGRVGMPDKVVSVD